jgi:hypothetical protein
VVDNLKAHITVDPLRLHHLTSNNTNNNNIRSNNSMPTKTKINHPATTREVVMETDEILTNKINHFSKFKI